MNSTDYDADFFAWANEQAELLRAGRFSQLDVDHIAEEIEDLGKRERRALQGRLGVLLGHLLKWRYQSDYPYRKSWRATINTQRRALRQLLDENPSLKASLEDVMERAYADGVDLAVAETPLDYDAFPPTCPWTPDEAIDEHWPGGEA
jgi:hypothetical protein